MSLTSCSKVFTTNNKSLSNYLINKVSDFAKDKKENGGVGKYEGISNIGFCIKDIEEGKICIDEKDIQGQVYTIISNSTNTDLIGMYPGVKASDVIPFFKNKLPLLRRESVKEVSADMSPTIEAIISELFPKAQLVTDRFHVMKNVLEDLRAIKSRIKTAIKKRISDEEKTYNEKINKLNQTSKLKAGRGRPAKTQYKAKRHNTGETDLDIITRIGRQIRKRKSDWNSNQINRRNVAKEIPELNELIVSYEYLHMFWMIYDEDIQKEEGKQKIQQRIAQGNEIRQTIIEVDNVISTIEKRLESISNYFISGHSNGFAEGLNSRIQRLISMSRGFKNKDYMIYRIIKLFSGESHLI